MPNRVHALFKDEHKFGLGGVSLGNEFNKVVTSDADDTLQAAWDVGVRYYDVAPWYGLGLSERRFGHLLHDKPRDQFLLSTKVGKLLKAAADNDGKKYYPLAGSPNSIVFDYTGDGVRRSIEDSLQRLGVDHIDFAFVHDISPDYPWFDRDWTHYYDEARDGAFPALSQLRDQGVIRGWGIGVNCPEPILKVLADADPDIILCARQYSLIDHDNAVEQVFPAVEKAGVALVMGSALNAGFVSGSARYNYGQDNFEIPADAVAKRDRIKAVAGEHGVDLLAAALQFSLAAKPAVATIVGCGSRAQVLEDWNAIHAAKIPGAFWQQLRAEKLIHPDAATPSVKG